MTGTLDARGCSEMRRPDAARHDDGGRIDGAAARREARDGPAGRDDPRCERRVGEGRAARGGTLREELSRAARQALGIARTPHRGGELAGRGGHDLPSLIGAQELHIGEAVGMSDVSQLGGVPNLVFVRAEVEVAAEAELELVAVLGDFPPDLERLHRERQLGGLTPLHADRALRAPGLLQAGSGLLLDQDHTRAPPGERVRGHDAAGTGADDDHVSATREIVLGQPARLSCLRREARALHCHYGITNY
jgi:hypothetical protein